jgi:hypothetical protein
MSFGNSSFFDSPKRQSKPDGALTETVEPELDLRFDTDAFFGERITTNNKTDDALTDETSPNTRGTTPARSEGWLVEDEPLETDGLS